MDKPQKELMKSYFHNRELISDVSYGMYGGNGGIQPYELLYMIKAGIAVDKKIGGHNIAEIIKYNPSLFKDPDIKPYLSRIEPSSQSNIIQHHPEFLDIFGVENMENDEKGIGYVSSILTKQPQLADRFDLNKLKRSDKLKILTKQPQFIEYEEFANILPKKETDSLGSVMFRHNFLGYGFNDKEDTEKQHKIFLDAIAKYPQFQEFFVDDLKKMRGHDIKYLLNKNYSLLKYFDFSNLDDYDMLTILMDFPELVVHMDQGKLNHDLRDWRKEELLKKQPQLKKYFTDG